MTAIPSRSKGERIRLRGIDAPEFNQTCRKDGATYPCGRRSREALARLIGGRPVACTGWERDRYGRLLGDLHGRRQSISTAPRSRRAGRSPMATTDAEQAARQRGAGLWAGSFERPRDWRDKHGGMVESEHDLLGRDRSTGCARSSASHDAAACAVCQDEDRRKR